MKILHVVRNLEIGGMERVVLQLAEAQLAAGHSVAIAEVELSSGDRYRLPDGLAHAVGKGSLCRQIFGGRPDVVHAHNLVALRATWLPARLGGRRLVFSKHGMHFPAGFCRWLIQRPDVCVAVSKPIYEKYKALCPRLVNKLRYVPNGIATNEPSGSRRQSRDALGIPQSAFVMLWVGRMVPEKGLDVLLHAVGKLTRRDMVLCLVGDGPERTSLENLPRPSDSDVLVRFEGTRQDVSNYYAASDLFVMPSRTEGLPMALLEAGVAGLPAVVSDVGAMGELVRASGGGKVVNPDDAAELAGALNSIIDTDASQRSACGQGLRQYLVDRYSAEAVHQSTMDCYAGKS